MKDNGKRVFKACIIVSLVFLAVFAVRLADWQLIHSEDYRSVAARSAGYVSSSQAVRGEILDRGGEGLVVNTTHFEVVIDKPYIDEKSLDSTLLALVGLLKKTGDKWTDVLPVYVRSGGYSFIASRSDEANRLKERLELDSNASADECMDELIGRYSLDGNYTPEQLRTLVSIHCNMELEDFSGANPYVFAPDISRAAVDAVSENTQDSGGIEIRSYYVRQASSASIAPHVLGALGAISEEELSELGDKGYSFSDKIGKFGIELACEDELRGSGGTRIVSHSEDGAVDEVTQLSASQPGNSVWLTLDKKLQATAAESLERNVKAARADGQQSSRNQGKIGLGEDCETGAAVMLSVSDFSVLAAASYPTFDLNKYSEYGEYYIKLSQDKNAPMYNRATVGSFACGSVFKPCVAMAALEEKTITPETRVNCTRFYDYYPTNVVECMHYHGEENFFSAITQSCNYFFAEAGRKLGAETMYLYAQRFGLGEYTGLEIEESRGTLAYRDSSSWQAGNTVQAAIGQSDNSFTPVQLAAYTATIANNGVRLKAHIIDKITDYERKTVISQVSPETVGECGVSRENLKRVQEAMLGVTQSQDGTAHYFFGDYKVKVAAKTGTAENSGSDHTAFICYAPYENPEVAIAVVLEHGVKGKFSMQVAKDLLDVYFERNGT